MLVVTFPLNDNNPRKRKVFRPICRIIILKYTTKGVNNEFKLLYRVDAQY